MRRLFSSLLVLASVVSANGVAADRISTQPASSVTASRVSTSNAFVTTTAAMRPAQNRASQFNRSQQSSLLRKSAAKLSKSHRPVERLPQATPTTRLPVGSSRLLGSSRSIVHSPSSALFRPTVSRKLQRRR